MGAQEVSYFTRDEKERLSFEWAGKPDTIGFMDVSHTQLSIARHSGGIMFNGHRYTYFPKHDELWRDDVLAMVHGWRRTDAMAKELPALPPQVQGELL
jgi:hypothetical protein